MFAKISRRQRKHAKTKDIEVRAENEKTNTYGACVFARRLLPLEYAASSYFNSFILVVDWAPHVGSARDTTQDSESTVSGIGFPMWLNRVLMCARHHQRSALCVNYPGNQSISNLIVSFATSLIAHRHCQLYLYFAVFAVLFQILFVNIWSKVAYVCMHLTRRNVEWLRDEWINAQAIRTCPFQWFNCAHEFVSLLVRSIPGIANCFWPIVCDGFRRHYCSFFVAEIAHTLLFANQKINDWITIKVNIQFSARNCANYMHCNRCAIVVQI